MGQTQENRIGNSPFIKNQRDPDPAAGGCGASYAIATCSHSGRFKRRIGEIIAGNRAVTVDTGLRLSRYFGTSDEFWTGLQLSYDQARAKNALADVLAKIKPLEQG